MLFMKKIILLLLLLLISGCKKEELESRIQNVAAAGKLSRFPGNVSEVLESCNDYESNLKLIKRIIKMGQ